MPDHPPLSCLKCPSLCCKLAGYIEVSQTDIRRLAKFLDLTPKEFEAKHVVAKNRKGEKLIKDSDSTCQFLGADRRCTVYAARPRDCRGYVCWDQDDETVYDFAKFFQMPIRSQQREERVAESKKRKKRKRR